MNKWIVLLSNAVLFALMALLLPIHFEENDDVIMCMIANGICSGTPDGHLVFINALYGWMLAGLYRLTKAVEWYSLSFCILHVLAMTGIACAILKDGKMKLLFKVLFHAFMYVIWGRIIIGFQFTTTAGLLCFSGCLALLQPTRKWHISGVCAIFVASLIRFHAAALVGVLFAPMLLAKLYKRELNVYVLVLVLLLVMIGHWADGLFYIQPDWANYKVYNQERGFINDNPNAMLIINNLPDGLDSKDFQLFYSFQGDPSIMTLTRLIEIKSKIKGNLSLQQAVSNISQLVLYRIPLLLLFLGFMACLIWNYKSSSGSRLRFVVLILTFLLWMSLLLYLGATASLKNRVFICMMLPMVYLLVKLSPPGEESRYKLLNVVSVLVLTGLVVKYSHQLFKVVDCEQSKYESFTSYQEPLLEGFEGILYPRNCNIECLPVMHIKDVGFKFVGLGWSSCIPFQKGVLESHRDFVDSEIAYFGILEAPPIQIKERIEKNYGIGNDIVVFGKNKKYALYQFVSK